ncbi:MULTISPECIES: hypothetical protein, partial [Heyndrickxia]
VTKPCQNIRPASSNYLNYYIFSRIFGGGIVKLSRKIFTPQSWQIGLCCDKKFSHPVRTAS